MKKKRKVDFTSCKTVIKFHGSGVNTRCAKSHQYTLHVQLSPIIAERQFKNQQHEKGA